MHTHLQRTSILVAIRVFTRARYQASKRLLKTLDLGNTLFNHVSLSLSSDPSRASCLFEGVLHAKANGCDLLLLAHPMDPRQRLFFEGRVPRLPLGMRCGVT